MRDYFRLCAVYGWTPAEIEAMRLPHLIGAWTMLPRLKRERIQELAIAGRLAHHAKPQDFDRAFRDLG